MRRLVLAAVLLVLVGCSDASLGGADTIEMSLYEFGISPSASLYDPGQVELVATNDGEFGHTIVVTSGSGEVVAASGLVAPGETLTMSVDLKGGAYVISCRIVTAGEDGAIFDHYEQGMWTEVGPGA